MSEVSAAIKELEIDIASVGSTNERLRTEAANFYRLAQSEQTRTGDLQRSLMTIENTLRVIAGERAEIVKDIDELRSENSELADANGKLSLDKENCEKHIGVLSCQNQQLMDELDKLSKEDELVRGMLDRRQKVKNSRSKMDALSRTSLHSNEESYY